MKKFFKILFRVLILAIVVIIVGAIIFVNTFDINSFKKEIITEVKTKTGAELIINGNMDLRLSLNPYFEINNVSLRNTSFPTTQDLLRVKKASVVISVIPLLYKTISIKELILESPNIYLTRNSSGQSNWDLITQNTKAPTQPSASKSGSTTSDSINSIGGYSIDLGKVSGSDIKIAYADGLTNKFYNLDIKAFDVTPKSGKNDVNIQAVYNNIPIAIMGTVSPITNIIFSNEIELDMGALIIDTRLGISGTTDVDMKNFDFKIKGHSPEIATAPKAFGYDIPVMGEFKLDGNIEGSLDKFKLALDNLSIGKSSVTGDVSVSQKPDVVVNYNLHSSMINLLELLQSEKSASAKPVAMQPSHVNQNSGKIFSNEYLPFNFLRTGSVKGAFTVDKLIWGKKETPITSTLRLNMNMANGGLYSVINSETDNGSAMVDLKLNIDVNNMARLDLTSKISMPSASVFVPKSNYIQGMPIELDIKSVAYGASVAQLMANMDGNIFLVVREGTIQKQAITWLTSDILTKTLDAIIPDEKKTEHIEFVCGAANIDIKSGILNLDRRVAVQTNEFNTISEGNVNLKTEALDVKFNFTSLKGLQVSLSDILSSLFEIKGTLANPTFGMGKDQIAENALRAGAALITGGLSLAGEKAVDIATEDVNPCQTAWNKGVRVDQNQTQQLQPNAPPQQSQSTVSKAAEKGKKAIDGAIKSLKDLF